MLGRSTFGLYMWLLKWFSIHFVDRFLLFVSWFIFGDTSCIGIDWPSLEPLLLKNILGKTPVLDIGTFAKIKTGHIKVCSGVKLLMPRGAEFVDGSHSTKYIMLVAHLYGSHLLRRCSSEDLLKLSFCRNKHTC